MCFDRILLKRAQSGDLEAIEKLLSKYEKYVFNTALGFFKDSFDASDAAQDAMIKIYRKLNSFRFESSFKSWVFRLTVNTCKDALRKRRDILTIDDNIFDNQESADVSPEKAVIDKAQREEIVGAIEKLDEDHKNVIILRDINDFTYDQIAKILDITVGTVKSRIFRARNKLKELLI